MHVASSSDELRQCVRVHNEVLPWRPLHAEERVRVLAGTESSHRRWHVARDVRGAIVGAAWAGNLLDLQLVGVVVTPAARGRGLGTKLLEAALVGVDGPVTCFTVDALDPAAQALARGFGFEPQPEDVLTHWRSALLEPTIDPDEVEVLTEAHLGDDEFVARFTELAAASVEDSPGLAPPTAEEHVHIEHRRLASGGFTVLIRNDDHELVACTTTAAAPHAPWLTSDHTMVLPAHRGRGYGLAAKRAQHHVAVQRGYERVVTDVRPDNPHMHAILRRLGYEQVPTPAWITHEG